MKRRLNILCLLVILTLCWSVVETSYYLFLGFRAGYESAEGHDTHMGPSEEIANMKNIHLIPDGISIAGGDLMRDSVYNEKSGRFVPAAFGTIVVSVKSKGWTQGPWLGLLTLAGLFLILKAMVVFFKLVSAINRSQIFCWDNVRRLRRLGLILLLAFGCTASSAYINMLSVSEVFSMPGYKLSCTESISITLPVLALCSLIVAEVFAIGLKLKEEQDLTI